MSKGVIGYNINREIYQSLMSGENKKRKNIMKIYMDNCCYNRLFDDRSNIKNYLEREAVLLVLELIYEGRVEIIGSDVLVKEMLAIKDIMKRRRIHALYQNCVLQSILRIRN